MTVATRQIGATLEALLDGRWDDARHGYVVASRIIEGIGYLHTLALLRLVVGHLADDRFPEAVDGLRAAESYFGERGADTVVVRLPREGRDPSAGFRDQAPARPVASRSPDATASG